MYVSLIYFYYFFIIDFLDAIYRIDIGRAGKEDESRRCRRLGLETHVHLKPQVWFFFLFYLITNDYLHIDSVMAIIAVSPNHHDDDDRWQYHTTTICLPHSVAPPPLNRGTFYYKGGSRHDAS